MKFNTSEIKKESYIIAQVFNKKKKNEKIFFP